MSFIKHEAEWGKHVAPLWIAVGAGGGCQHRGLRRPAQARASTVSRQTADRQPPGFRPETVPAEAAQVRARQAVARAGAEKTHISCPPYNDDEGKKPLASRDSP
jgi:hypothetical protein